MPRPLALAALILSCAVPCVHAEEGALGSVRLPLPAAELAASVGIHRVDPSSLPIDLVRLAFASPDNASAPEAAARARLSEALARRGSGDPIPLPLSPRVWRDQILREQVRDDDLAARIFSRRNTALLYHGLLAVDLDTLGWIERNPAVVRSLLANPGAAAVFAESIVVRGGAIATPGEDAREVWTALVGADPAQPAAFVARLLSADGGAVAAFYHTIARLDPPRQAFAIGRRGEPRRVERARDLLAASRLPAASWSSDRPFLRPDIDLLLLLRTITVDGRGVPGPPASRALWSKVFAQGSGAAEPIDAAWLARHVFGTAPGQARRRLEVFRFAQQMFGAAAVKEDELAAVLREHARLPILFGVLATFDERDAGAYAAARRAAAAVDGDDVATTVFQSALAIVDRARRSRTLDAAGARTLSRSLADAAALSDARRAMAAWFAETLVPALRRVGDGDSSRAIEQVVVEALAGPSLSPPVVVHWEDSEYIADLAPAELRRLLRVRRRQAEMPIDDALARARNGEAEPLAASLAALVYACALGDDGASANAGAVWRRHRFRGALASQGAPLSAWRLAAEVFAPEGWHVAGSLLRLDLALAPVALRRLDATEMPAPSQLSTSDRRTLATTIALLDPQRLTDADRDAIAAALARGRERIQRLAAAPDDLDRVAKDAALSGWRRNGVAWLLATDPARVPAAFTVLEQLRAGGGSAPDSWGAASFAVDGCLCVRQPDPAPWEDYGGRASSGQLGSQLPDVLLRTADVLARHQLPALLARDVAAYAMQDAIDRARTAYFDDWLPVALAVRELPDDRFVDYIAALTVAGPLVPKGVR